MKPVFNDLVSEIQRSIGFYASTHRDARLSRVLALGGTFRLPGLQKYVQQNLQVEVHRIDRLGAGAPAEARAATMFSENILSSVSAYGLAIQALGDARISSSLLPMRIRREKLWQEKTRWFGAAAAVFIAAPLLAYGSIYFGKYNLDTTASRDRENRNSLTQFDGFSNDWDQKVENAGAPDRIRTTNFQSLDEGRDVQATLLTDIASCLPPVPAALMTNDKAKLGDRSTRPIVRIDRIAMDYHPDMAEVLGLSDDAYKAYQVQGLSKGRPSSGQAPGFDAQRMLQQQPSRTRTQLVMPTPAPAAAGQPQGAPKQRGFVVEIVCTTPMASGASFVLNTFVKKLQALSPSNPHVSYSVPKEKVIEPLSTLLGSDPNMKAGPDLGGYMPANRMSRGDQYRPTSAGAPEKPKFNPLEDPATKEDMSNDTRVTIRMCVLLDPPKAPANGAVAQSNP